MAEQNAAAPTGGAGPAGQQQPRLLLHSQFLQDMSFENPEGAKSFARTDSKPQVQVNLNVDSRKVGETVYEVALKIQATASQNDATCFIAELDYRGIFSLTGVADAVVPQVLLIEGPRMLFPFARRIVADAVRDGGFPPLLLEPVDFVALYRQHAQKQPQQDAAAAAPPAGEAKTN